MESPSRKSGIEDRRFPTPRIGIALSGGGARGIAHIGVLQALEENGISPGFVSGASAGALVGVLYAAGVAPTRILSIFKSKRLYQLFRLSVSTRGLIDLGRLKHHLKPYVADDFGALERRLFVAVVNLTAGRLVIADSGPLLDYIVATASVPFLFKPWTIDGELYSDGGVLNNLPVEPLLGRCDAVIGVNVTPIEPAERLRLRRLAERHIDLIMWNSVESRLRLCDVAIQPRCQDFAFFDTKKADQLHRIGYAAAQGQMADILTAVGKTRPGQ